ncbi:MAG: hypothetical protein IT370_21470 [Deltaproteobacteria bacterium]|nr:hypothetical protein [Deltaproteobacteria bacterium]
MTRASAAVLALLLLELGGQLVAPRLARAGACSNPCGLPDGGLCVDVFVPGQGFAPSRIVAAKAPLELRAGQQQGSCGGLLPLAAAELTWSAASSPDGSASPLPVQLVGPAARFTPDRAGPLFLTVARRDGRGQPDHLVLLVGAALRKLTLTPPRGGKPTLVMRWRAPATSEAAGFARARWPTPVGPLPRRDAGGAWSVSVPDGDYEVDWQAGADSARVAVTVTADSPVALAVPVPAARLRVQTPKVKSWVQLAVRDAAGLVQLRCVQGGQSWSLRLPAGPTEVAVHLPSGAEPCPALPASAPTWTRKLTMPARGSVTQPILQRGRK